MKKLRYRLVAALAVASVSIAQAQPKKILFKNGTVIDGTGLAPRISDILVSGDRIVDIRANISDPTAQTVDLTGKTVIPSLICAHAHVGTLKGTTSTAENYTRENVLRHLKRYEDYGVGAVLALGTDRPLIFESGLRDSTTAGLLPGARLYSAGYGFNTPDPKPASWMNMLQRPETPEQAVAMVAKVAALKPSVLKIWVDDHGGGQKMNPEIYQAIIQEAHKKGIRVAAHLFYLEDAKLLVAAGLDIIAHSIRDKEVDADLLKNMRKRGVIYIPTLALDEYNFVYGDNPSWINDPFFKASLESGVFEMISNPDYKSKIRYSADYEKNKTAAKISAINLKKIYDAGILVALGTDSGAFPIRAQGFTEHHELDLMVQAGLSPLQAITVSTKNAARALKIADEIGSLEKGKKADLIVLDANPEQDIKNTQRIISVWKDGKLASKGPLAK